MLAEATQTWSPGVPDFNARLPQLAAAASLTGAPVVVADADTGYDAFAHTWDEAHPNAAGEVRIAAAVADALAGLGVGPPASRPLPVVPLGPRLAPLLRAVPGDGAATLTWTGPPGATAQLVAARRHGARGMAPAPVARDRVDVVGAPAHERPPLPLPAAAGEG